MYIYYPLTVCEPQENMHSSLDSTIVENMHSSLDNTIVEMHSSMDNTIVETSDSERTIANKMCQA